MEHQSGALNQCTEGQLGEHPLARLVHRPLRLLVLHPQLPVEAVHLGAGYGLVVASQEVGAGRERELPGTEKEERLQAPCAAVNKVTVEDVDGAL